MIPSAPRPPQIPLGDVPQAGVPLLAMCPRLAGRLGYPHYALHVGLGVERLKFLAACPWHLPGAMECYAIAARLIPVPPDR